MNPTGFIKFWQQEQEYFWLSGGPGCRLYRHSGWTKIGRTSEGDSNKIGEPRKQIQQAGFSWFQLVLVQARTTKRRWGLDVLPNKGTTDIRSGLEHFVTRNQERILAIEGRNRAHRVSVSHESAGRSCKVFNMSDCWQRSVQSCRSPWLKSLLL